MAGYPSIFEYLGYAPARRDGAIAPTGGSVLQFTAATTLNSGDLVYCPATTPTAVNKSTTTSLYAAMCGVVVGGQATGKRAGAINADGTLQDTGIICATVGQIVWVQNAGIARVVAGGTIAAGDRVMADSGTAGRVITYTSPNFVIGIALDAATVGTKLRILFTNSASTVFAPTTDSLLLGASPPTAPGAIRVDASSYTSVVLKTINGTVAFQVNNTSSAVRIGTFSNHNLFFDVNSVDRWVMTNDGATTANFTSNLATARITGGATNGLAIRDSTNTRDNLLIADSGATLTLSNGTSGARLSIVAAAGDQLLGGVLESQVANDSTYLRTSQVGTTSVAGILYFDGTVPRSAVEVLNVASGFSTLRLMKSGGAVQQGGTIGTASQSYTLNPKDVTAIADATGTAVLTVTIPNARTSASLKIKLVGALGAGGAIGAGEAVGSVTYDISIARTAGVATVVTASTAYGSAMVNVAGAATITVTAVASAISGGAGASNTFTVNVTITKGSGASANHTCLVLAEILNYATGTATIA